MDKELKKDVASVLARLRSGKIEYYLVYLDRGDIEDELHTERYASELVMSVVAMNIIRQKP